MNQTVLALKVMVELFEKYAVTASERLALQAAKNAIREEEDKKHG